MDAALTLGAVALFVVAATTDALERRIPNGVSLGLALVGLLRIGAEIATGGALGPAAADVAAASGVFVLGAAGFHFGLLGGGDVKLFAAGALWLGVAGLPPYLTTTALAGGLLALGFIAARRLGWLGEPTLPYGIAIAAGGLRTTGGGAWT
jgi:prepilin peptidase CpaA